MASQDGQTKTNTENTGAESVKELEQNQSPYVTDIDDTTEDGELVCKKQKLADVTQGDDVNPGEAENKKEENKDEIRIVLVGKTASELENSLLESPVFQSEARMSIKSTLILIDTPDTTKSNEESTKAIIECINLSHPGPHVFIIVVSLASRLPPEDQQTIDYIEQIFGKESCLFMIIVFTNTQYPGVEIDDTWVRHADQEPLKPLLEKVYYRYTSIDNNGEKVEDDVKSIIELIKQTIKDNNNEFYTGEMYEEPEILYIKYLEEKKERKERKEKLEQLKKDYKQLIKENNDFKLKCEQLEREKKENKGDERTGGAVKKPENKTEEKNEEEKNEEKAKLRREIELEITTKIQEEERTKIREEERIKIREEEERTKLLDLLPSELKRMVELKLQPSTSKDTDHQQESKPGRRERVRGPIKEPDRTILREKIPSLLKMLKYPKLLIPSLIARYVFDDDDKEKVEREIRNNGTKAGMTKLLDILLDCGSDALQLFMECLKDTNCKPALKLLQSAINKDESGDNDVDGEQTRQDIFPGEERTGEAVKKPENKTKEKNEEETKKEEKDDVKTGEGEKKIEKKKKEEKELEPDQSSKFTDVGEDQADPTPDNEVKSDVGCGRELISSLHEESLNCKDMNKYKLVVDKYIQDINKTDGLGSTPLLKACISQYHPIEKLILLQQSGADINITNNNNDNALHLACSLGSLDTVKYLIEELQFNIETPGFTSRTPLHQSSYSKTPPLGNMKYLITKGVNVKTVDNNNNNALHLAYLLGSLVTVKYIIEGFKFNVEAPGFTGRTPLHQSSYYDRTPLHQSSYYDRTPLHQSSYSKISPVEKMKYLISKGVNVQTVDSLNNNALHLACRFGSLNTVKYLIEELQFNIETPGFTGQTPLHQASYSQKSPLEKMKYLISKGVNVKTVDSLNNNALHLACYLGSLDTVKYIIEELQFNIETPGYSGRTPLHQSSYSDILPVAKMKYLISKGVNIETVDSQYNNALHLACVGGSLDTVKYITEELQFNIETPGLVGRTSLHQSSQSEISPVEKMKYLISKGVIVKTVDYVNNNALHLACDLGSLDTVKYLIEELQFNIETPGFTGRTPLHQSSQSKISPVEKMKYLISKGVNVQTVDNNNNNALHLACGLGSLDTVKYIIEELKFNIETPGYYDRTPLNQSSCSEILPVEKMKYLISKGVNVKTVDSENNNPLHLACDLGSLDTVKYIIEEFQFNIETPGFNGRTALHQSSKSKISPVAKMKYLISKGVHVKTVDNNNDNALHLACSLGSLETVIFLVESGCNINPVDGKKPLFYCSLSELQPVDKIKYLISVGAKLTLQDKQFYISRAKLTETKEFFETL